MKERIALGLFVFCLYSSRENSNFLSVYFGIGVSRILH